MVIAEHDVYGCCSQPNIIMENETLICSNCGMIIEEDNTSYTFENIYEEKFKYYDSIDFAKYSNRTLFRTDSDAKGATLNAKTKFLYSRLLKIQRSRTYSFESSLIKCESLLREICQKMNISRVIQKDCFSIASKIIKRKLHLGYTIDDMTIAVFIAVCRWNKKPIFLEDVFKSYPFNMSKVRKFYEKLLQEILQKLSINKIGNITVSSFSELFTNRLNIPFDIKRQIMKVSHSIEKTHLRHGKDPKGLSSAIIYSICKNKDFKINQRQICEVSCVTEVTLRNSLKKITDFYKSSKNNKLLNLVKIEQENSIPTKVLNIH